MSEKNVREKNEEANGSEDTERTLYDTENLEDDTENNINDTEKLTSREIKILSLIQKDNSISRKVIAQNLEISTATVARNINSLKTKGIIERVGGDKGGYWKIK